MKCENCGNEIPENSKFCTSCGAPVQVKSASENIEGVSQNQNSERASSTAAASKVSDTVKDIATIMEGKQVEINGKKFNMLQLIVYIGAVVELIACFLPMYSISFLGETESINYFDGDAIIAIILLVITCVLTFMNQKLFAMIAGILNMIKIVYDVFSASGAKSELGAWGDMLKTGIGCYLIVIAAIMVFAGAVLAFVNEKKTH